MKDFKTAIRNLKRNGTTTAIIIISLSLGFGFLNLIATFLAHELKTDSFQTDKDRIYSVIADDPYEEGSKTYQIQGETMEYIKSSFPMVEDVIIYNGFNYLELSVAGENFTERPKAIETESNFFNFFSYPLLIGNPKTVFEGSNGILISNELARKYFSDEYPIGKRIDFKNVRTTFKSSETELNEFISETKTVIDSYIITGIFKKPDQNSMLDFDLVLSFSEKPDYDCKGFIKLTKTADAEELVGLFAEYKSQFPNSGARTQSHRYHLKSLKDTYFDTTRASYRYSIEKYQNRTTVWIVGSIGLLIMVLAMFNFLGIINYNLLERAKNYSIYQLSGANKIQLIKSVLAEILLLLVPSFLLGLVIMSKILPLFNRLIISSLDKNYSFQLFNLGFLSLILFISFILSLLFIVYKLNAITGYSALNGVKTNLRFQLPVLNVFQLSVTIILITASLIITKQIQFINNRPIGVNMQVMNISVPMNEDNKTEILKTKLLQFTSIDNVSLSQSSLFHSIRTIRNYNEDGEQKSFTYRGFSTDKNFVETLGIKVIVGNDFPEDAPQHSAMCLINESMAKKLNIEDLADAKFPGNTPIIGIVEDFNYESLQTSVSPAVIQLIMGNTLMTSNIFIKATDTKKEQALQDIKQAWDEIYPDTPFQIQTIQQQYQNLHAKNKKTIQLIVLCCVVSILLSMMGLFAVVLQNSKLRTKEIGIRKVNGAKISEVMFLLNQDFIKWVIVAFIISTPLAFYTMYKWLQSFAYKTELSWWVFALAGLLALGIALLTVSFQSWKAATRNPVESLRYE